MQRKKANIEKDDNSIVLDSQTKGKSNKRNRTTKETSTVLVTNQLQQVEDTLPKRSNKKFFTSKQRKQERTPEKCGDSPTDNIQPDMVEDRENMPRVPPLKLRIKAANAAALSIDSFTKPDKNNHGQINKSKHTNFKMFELDWSINIPEIAI